LNARGDFVASVVEFAMLRKFHGYFIDLVADRSERRLESLKVW